MRLATLIQDIPILDVQGSVDIEVNNIAYDSRKVQKGSAFVCIVGFKVDGHKFIEQVLSKGVKVLIVQKNIKPIEGVSIIRVENTRKALPALAAAFYEKPTKNMNVVGVTGTNGKTTITHLIKDILEYDHKNCGLIGTIAYKILDKVYHANNTTPESLELQKLFKEMKDQDVKYCAMEVSSHSLDLMRVDDIAFKIGIFTNLTEDHLDYHKNFENYKKAKTKLFYQTSVANIINIDDPYGEEIAKEISTLSIPLITYGINKKSDIFAKDIKISSEGSAFTVVGPDFKGRIHIATPGKFSVYNAIAAIAACYRLKMDFKKIKEAIESVSGVRGRFETIKKLNRTIIIDYSHTPDALENALKTIKEFAQGKMITVFGCGGDRDKKKRPMMGKIAGELSDYCIITSDNPRSEDPYDIMEEIEVGIKNTNCQYKMIVDRKKGIEEAIHLSQEQDIILIAGKGHETYQILGDKKIDFDDKQVALKLMGEENLKCN